MTIATLYNLTKNFDLRKKFICQKMKLVASSTRFVGSLMHYLNDTAK